MTESRRNVPARDPEQFPGSTSRSKKKRWLFVALGSLLLLLLCVWGWHYLSGFESTDDAQVDVHLYPVSSRIRGYVERVNAQDNQYVPAGSCLIEIDPRDYQVTVNRARAELGDAVASAKALAINVPISSVDSSSRLQYALSDVGSAAAGVTAAEKKALSAHARVLQARAEDTEGQDDVKRYRLLLARNEIPGQVFDHAFANAATDDAAVTEAEANEAAALQAVQQARNHLMEAKANYEAALAGPQRVASERARALAASAMVQQKQANLAQAELNLAYTQVVAPVSGEVTKNVVVGMNVEPGEQLLTVVPLDKVWITANFKETQLRHMRPGQRAEITLDSTGRTYEGRVNSIAGATGPIFSLLPPENATGNYVKIVQRVPVKIVLDPGANRDHQLRPGMNVVVKVLVR
ncbi:MAG TPA: HlyD family secretion protein [Acidobacteriaceae bacterium]|nr:HlyD family secretion protein [Acidobacteriaceae bacterium]